MLNSFDFESVAREAASPGFDIGGKTGKPRQKTPQDATEDTEGPGLKDFRQKCIGSLAQVMEPQAWGYYSSGGLNLRQCL